MSECTYYRVEGRGYEWTDWETAARTYSFHINQGEQVKIEEKSVYIGTISQEEIDYRFQLDAEDARMDAEEEKNKG